MKRVLVGLLMVACAAVMAGAQGFAVGPLVYWTSTTTSSPGVDDTASSLTLGATVPFMLDAGLELAPELSMTFGEDEIGMDTSDDYFSFGAGAYWRMNKAGAFSLKTGPKLMMAFYTMYDGVDRDIDDNFSRFGLSLAVPLVADLELSDLLTLRLVQPIALLSFEANSYTNVATEKVTVSSFSLSTFYTGLYPTFIFLFKF